MENVPRKRISQYFLDLVAQYKSTQDLENLESTLLTGPCAMFSYSGVGNRTRLR